MWQKIPDQPRHRCRKTGQVCEDDPLSQSYLAPQTKQLKFLDKKNLTNFQEQQWKKKNVKQRSVMKIGETEVARLIRLVRFSRMTELIGHLAAFFRSGMFPTIMGIVKIMAGSLSMKAVAAQVSFSLFSLCELGRFQLTD